MPYILLGLGCIVGLYALYRFFLKADVKQIKALFLTILLITLSIALFYMAITGRLAAALAFVVALAPVIHAILKEWRGKNEHNENTTISSREEALDILGLQDGASVEEIKTAYTKLMKKVHPDAEGSEWMAAKLNQARDILLDKPEDRA